jgi:hypothetical protein
MWHVVAVCHILLQWMKRCATLRYNGCSGAPHYATMIVEAPHYATTVVQPIQIFTLVVAVCHMNNATVVA